MDEAGLFCSFVGYRMQYIVNRNTGLSKKIYIFWLKSFGNIFLVVSCQRGDRNRVLYYPANPDLRITNRSDYIRTN